MKSAASISALLLALVGAAWHQASEYSWLTLCLLITTILSISQEIIADLTTDSKYASSPTWLMPFRVVHNITILPIMAYSLVVFWVLCILPLQLLQSAFQYRLGVGFGLVAVIIKIVWFVPRVGRWKSAECGNHGVGEKAAKTVAIIGAGPVGICTAKELLAEGIIPTVFEKTDSVGGLWQRGGTARSVSVLDNTVSSSSALNTSFSDFPISAEFAGKERHSITQKDYMDYLDQYVQNFELHKHVQLKKDVVAVTRSQTSDENRKKMQVKYRDVETGVFTTKEFDQVAVCTGQAQIPKSPPIKGQESFKGTITHGVHMQNKSDFAKFKDRQVLCIGGGESASDIASELARETMKCDISIHGIIHWVPSFTLFWKCLFKPDVLTKNMGAIQTTKSENFLYIIDGKSSQLKVGVSHINDHGSVVFTDGSIQQYDDILLMTGYTRRWDFLDEKYQVQSKWERFVDVFHPELPGIAFLGFIRGNVGAVVLIYEMQARLFAQVAAGKIQIGEDEMKQGIKAVREGRGTYEAVAHAGFYANYIARNFLGCEPDGCSLFLRSPLAWAKAYMGPMNSIPYRLRGPHATTEATIETLKTSSGGFTLIPTVWMLQHPIWIMIGFSCDHFWSKLPLIGRHLTPNSNVYF